MEQPHENLRPGRKDPRYLNAPVAFVKRLAALVERALELQPEALTPYVVAAEESGHAYASQVLWNELAREERPVAEAWEQIRHGSIDNPVAARHTLMLLLALDGWSRLKVCDQPGCHRTFADATNALSRRRCALHMRRPSGG